MLYDNRFLCGLAAAWELLADFPMPGNREHRFAPEVDDQYRLLALPVVGALLALGPIILGQLGTLIFNRLLGAAIFALSAGIIFYFKDSGRGILLLASLVSELSQSRNLTASLLNLRHDGDILERGTGVIFITIFIMIELALLFILGYFGAFSWLFALGIASAWMQGVLAVQPRQAGFSPFIAHGRHKMNYLYWSAGILGFGILLLYPCLITLLVLAGLYCTARLLVRYLQINCGGVNSDLITLTGAVTESVVLLCGLGVIVIG